jgi:hypothetical protein
MTPDELQQALLAYLEDVTFTGTFRTTDHVQVGLERYPVPWLLEQLQADDGIVPSWVCNGFGLLYGTSFGDLVDWIAVRLEE